MADTTDSHAESRLCLHFGECGGCRTQDVPYEIQVREKQDALQELFAPHWAGDIPVTPSPLVWHYRNKVDPAFARKRYEEKPPDGFDRETVLGYKKRGQWYWPLDIQECRIGPEGLGAFMGAVRDWARSDRLKAFDDRTGEGILRGLLVREGKRTGERMAVLITRDGLIDGDGFARIAREVFGAHSVYRGYYRGLADVSECEELELLAGAEYIHERLDVPDGEGARPLTFRISPMSFFQTNTLAAEKLYGHIREWVRAVAPTRLYDLYGGAGGIAFACCDLVDFVYSVESVLPASEDGRVNAVTNGIANVTFITSKVKNYLLDCTREMEAFPEGAAAIVDPPRAGMHPKALKRLLALRPEHLLYVSCNPKLLVREMPEILKYYRLNAMRAVDLFPHTPHVEALAAFSREQ
jgi:23S rRNA (uracil1939-C5)-methyltransferase